jgi:hypothetical protein
LPPRIANATDTFSPTLKRERSAPFGATKEETLSKVSECFAMLMLVMLPTAVAAQAIELTPMNAAAPTTRLATIRVMMLHVGDAGARNSHTKRRRDCAPPRFSRNYS